TICQGHLGLPDVDRRAASRGTKARRHAGVYFPDRACRASLLHQKEGVARGGIASGEAQATSAERISARVSEPLGGPAPAPRSGPAARASADCAVAIRLHPRRRGRDMTKAVLGIIGGSGIYDLPGLEKVRQRAIKSPWGEPSSSLRVGEIA